jgi:hypothetical protein
VTTAFPDLGRRGVTADDCQEGMLQHGQAIS